MPRLTTMLILTGARPAARAAAIPSSTRASGHVDAAHGPEDRVVERVEADGDPLQPGFGERAGERPER